MRPTLNCWPEEERPSATPDPFGVHALLDDLLAAVDDSRPIVDRYGWTEFPAVGGHVMRFQDFPSLGVQGPELLSVVDPAEAQRVEQAIRDRTERHTRRTGTRWPLVALPLPIDPAEEVREHFGPDAQRRTYEERALARAGLTITSARERLPR